MITLPLAHAGHWLASALYLAPIVVLAVVLFVQARRDRGASAAEEASQQKLQGGRSA
jgi:hypothetical protein